MAAGSRLLQQIWCNGCTANLAKFRHPSQRILLYVQAACKSQTWPPAVCVTTGQRSVADTALYVCPCTTGYVWRKHCRSLTEQGLPGIIAMI